MIDILVYVSDIEKLTKEIRVVAPEVIGEDGSWISMEVGPTVRKGDALLAYRRISTKDRESLRKCDSATILGEAPYLGESVADSVYSQVFSNPESKGLYDSVYSSDPVEMETGDVVYTLDSSEPTEATVTFEVGGGTMSMRVNVDSPTELWSMAGVPIKVEPESISVSEPVPQTYTYNPPERFGSL